MHAAVLAVIVLAGVAVAQQLTDVRTPPSSPVAAKPDLTSEQRGDIFMARKMYREAAEVYLESKPFNHIMMNKVGIAYHQMGQLGTARKWYEKSVKAQPKYSEAINNVGTVYYAQKNHRRAITWYRRALEIAPRSASIHSNLGTALFARKKYEDAAKEYEIALQLDPDVFEHRNTQGVLLQERTVEERARFQYTLAKMYAKQGQIERALQCMRKALEAGFKDRKKFEEESEFAKLRELPEFAILIKLEPRVL